MQGFACKTLLAFAESSWKKLLFKSYIADLVRTAIWTLTSLEVYL